MSNIQLDGVNDVKRIPAISFLQFEFWNPSQRRKDFRLNDVDECSTTNSRSEEQ